MAAAVEVLCPSGHRQKVKITPNTKILQVLEEVCTKKGFLPAEEYELRHGRKTLDVTLTVRFAGLPNHAKLELFKAEKTRAESEVVIALQVEDTRLQHSFSPGVTLWQVLEHWEHQPDSQFKDRLTRGSSHNLHPVCTYMREEVIGEFALRETTLRMLGLTGGRAMFRLSHREVEQQVLDSTREKIEKEKARQAKILAKAQESEPNTQATPVSSKSSREENKPETKPPVSSTSEDVPMDTESVPEPVNGKPDRQSAAPPKPDGGSFNNEPMEAEVSGASGSAPQPMEEVLTSGAQAMRDGSLRQGMSARQRQEASLNALENMPGVSVIRPGDFDELSPEQQEKARNMAANAFPGMFPSTQSARPKRPIANPQPAANPFANFKFPEATKGQDLYHNEYSDVNKEDFEPCDRETCLYSLDEEQSDATGGSDDVPDDFFEVTVSDVQRMYSDLQKSLQGMEEQSLMTSTMRKQLDDERISKYPRVVIRVQLPDRLVLQGVFKPRETVFALQKFVKEHIEDKSLPFYLYTTPPKYLLKDNAKTLYEAKLVPLTVVHFGSEIKKDHYLSDPVLCEIGSRNAADKVVYKHMKDKSGEGTSEYRSRPKRSGSATATASTSKGDQPNVPKWFKLGKK